MSRPENVGDIEPEAIELGSVDTSKIATNGPMLKAYATFMEAMQRAGAEVEMRYNGSTAYFKRQPTLQEMGDQLTRAQDAWDAHQRDYSTLREIGHLEHSYRYSSCEEWAAKEGLKFPPDHEPIEAFDAVIRDIDEVVS